MRDYAKWAPTFWTGKTGREIRKIGRDAQVVALYLGTCPSSNWIGLYYLPLSTLCYEVGISPAKATRTMEQLAGIGFAYYDHEAELAWLPNAAKYQIGDELKPGDKRVAMVKKDIKPFSSHRFCRQFVARYGPAYHLPPLADVAAGEDSFKDLGRGIEAPSKPVTEAVDRAEAVAGTKAEAGDREGGAKNSRPRKRCPEDFTVTDDMRKWAAKEAPQVNVDRETSIFKDHEFQKPKSDWLATWRNWIRRAAGGSGNAVGPLDGGSNHAAARAGVGGGYPPQNPRKPFEGAPAYTVTGGIKNLP